MRSTLFVTTLLVVLLSLSVNAATYNITSNSTFNSVIGGSGCTNCTFNISPGKTLTFNGGTCDGCAFIGGTVLINNNITLNTVSFSGSSVTVSSFANVQVNNALTVDNTDIYLNPLSAFTASGSPVSIQNGSNITLTDLSVFSVSNTLPISASTITMNTVLFPAELTAAAITMTGSQLTTTGASSIIQSTNNFDATTSTITLNNGSAITASSSTLTSAALVLNSTSSLTVTNGLDLKSSTAVLNGSSNITANMVTLQSNSSALIGDGTAGGAAWLKAANGLTTLDYSMLSIAPGGRDYYTTGVSSFTGGTTSYSLTNNHINCNFGSVTSFSNSCSSSKLYGCATMSKFGATSCISLALGDINLTVELSGPNAISLTWSDPLSAVASQYQVQRCTDGYNYITIFTTTATGQSYQYTDATAPTGKTTGYRIVRTDRNGQSSYSDISTVTLASTTTDVQLYPNPAAGHNFFISSPTTAELDASIFTMSGQLLIQTRLKGQTRYPIHLSSGITPGSMVVVRVTGRQTTQTFTVLIN